LKHSTFGNTGPNHQTTKPPKPEKELRETSTLEQTCGSLHWCGITLNDFAYMPSTYLFFFFFPGKKNQVFFKLCPAMSIQGSTVCYQLPAIILLTDLGGPGLETIVLH
jgi:hypothetical protein